MGLLQLIWINFDGALVDNPVEIVNNRLYIQK